MSVKGCAAHIHSKSTRGGRMKQQGSKGEPTAANLIRAAQTVMNKYGLSHLHGNVNKVRTPQVGYMPKVGLVIIALLVVI